MGDVIRFPARARARARARNPNFTLPANLPPHPRAVGITNPVEALQHFLELARRDQFVFLGVHGHQSDGTWTSVEIGLIDDDINFAEDSPEEPA
jgi:hypothetical protein